MGQGELDYGRAALESSPDLVVVFDVERRARIVSDRICELLDLPRERLIGRRLTDLFDESDYLAFSRDTFEILDAVVGHAIETGLFHEDDDATRLTRDFEIQPTSLRLHPVREDGEIVGAVFVSRDLDLSGSLMFRRAAVGMAHVDRLGRVREANDALLELVDRDRAKLQNEPFTDLLHPDDVEAGTAALEDVLHGSAADRHVQLRMHRTDGAARWAIVSASSNNMAGEGVGGACVVVQDVTERVLLQEDLEAARERLQALALHDPLTGLPNRTHLERRLGEAQEAAARTGAHTAVLFIDLDGFKVVNDSAGHRAGDAVLVEVADRIRAALRPMDVAARFGGDEFIVCCGELDRDEARATGQAREIADRIGAALAEPFGEWRLGASIGMAVAAAASPDDLLVAADAEMYRVKTSRR